MTDFAHLGIKVDSQPVARARDELGRFVRAGRGASDAALDLEQKSGRAGRGLDRLGREARTSAGSVTAIGKAIGAVAVGLASFASAQQAVAQARGFNAAMSETATLIQGTRLELSFLRDESLRLTQIYGGSAEQQVRAFYQAISAGADSVQQAAQIIDQSNRLAIGGVTDVTTGVDALTTAVNAYSMTGLTAAEASDAMFVGMRAGKTTIGELSAQMGQIVPIASAAGVSFDEMIAGISALTTQGQSTAMATTGLRAAITGILQPSKQASDAARSLGLEFSASALQAKGLEQFMADVVKQTGGSTESMTQLFGSVEALNAVLAFSGAAGQTFTDIMAEMGEKTGATDAAFATVAQGLDQRLNAAMGKFGVLATQVGDVLLQLGVPAVEALAAAAGLLSDNFNSVIGIVSATGVAVATAYAPAIYGAVTATGAWIASLITLRGALLATGVGALVVGAGLLIGKFLDLVQATGGWGAAMRLLGSVVSGVWDGMKTTARAIVPALGAVWADVNASFLRLLQSMTQEWGAFLRAFSAGMEGIPGLASIQEKVAAAASNATTNFMELDFAASSLEGKAIRLRKEAGKLASDGFERASAALATLNMVIAKHGEGSDAAVNAAAEFNDALSDLDTGSGKAAKGLKKAKSEAEAFAEAMKEAAFTAEDFGKGKADVLISGIDGVSGAWGDFVSRGFSDFKGFARNILDTFKGMLSQMIAMAARNQIMIGLGFGGVAAGGAAQAAGSGLGLLGGAGNLLGLGGFFGSMGTNILGGGAFAAGSGLLGGFGSALNAGLGAGGSFGGLFSVGANAAAAGGGVAATIGAALPVLGAVALAVGFFRKKVVELDSGLRVTVDGMDALVESFSHIQTSRFWGLSKKRSTNYTTLDDEAAAPIQASIDAIGEAVVGFADTLGLASDNIANVAYQFQVSTKGLSDAEIQEALTREFDLLADEFAGAIVGTFTETNIADGAADILRDQLASAQRALASAIGSDHGGVEAAAQQRVDALTAQLDAVIAGTVDAGSEFVEVIEHINPEFAALQKEGEGAYDTLERLATSLGSFNSVADMLNLSMMDASLASGAAAASIVELAGGFDQFSASSQTYFSAFYSEQEQYRELLQQTRRALRDVGVALPTTRDGFRDLVEAQDLTSEAGQRAFAALMNLSGAADQIYDWREQPRAGGAADTGADQERYNLRTQILTLMGNEDRLRARALEQLDEGNRALQERIWHLEDEAAAEAAAAAVRRERYGLRTQLLTLQGRTERLRERELAQLDPSNRALQQRIWALQDEAAAAEVAAQATEAAAAAQRKLFEVLQGDVSSAMSAVSAAVSARMDHVRDSAQEQLDRLSGDLDAANLRADAARSAISGFIGDIENETVGSFKRMRDAIAQALETGLDHSAIAGAEAYRSAQADILRFAAGQTYTEDQLNSALSGLGERRIENYTDLVSYARDAAVTNQALRAIQGKTEDSLTEAEQQVAALRALYDLQEEVFPNMEAAISALNLESAKAQQLERQIMTLEGWRDRQITALENMLAAQEAQVNAALGIPTGLQSIADAISGLQSALGSLASVNSTQTRDQLRTAAITGQTGNVTALWDYEQRILGTNRADLKQWEQKVFDDLKVKGFSGGGFTGWGSRSGGLDGEGGFLAMLHPRETVVDHHRGQSIGGADLREMRAIRAATEAMHRDMMVALAKIAEHADRTSENTERAVRVGVKAL